MTEIERRQARIRKIRAQNSPAPGTQRALIDLDVALASPEAHHAIGKTENTPEDVGLFVQKHAGDPAFKVQIYRP